MIIEGAGTGATIVTAAGLNAAGAPDRVFDATTAGDLTISDLTLRDGTVFGRGGIIRSDASLQLTDVVVLNGRSTLQGGLIYSTDYVYLDGAELVNGRADTDGGGLATGAGGSVQTGSPSTISNCTRDV